MSSCQTGRSTKLDEQERNVQKILHTKPDSALTIIQQLLKEASASDTPNNRQIRLLLMRQQIFSDKHQMDSVLSIGVDIRRLALKLGDSLSIAKTLLPVRGEVSLTDQQVLEPWIPVTFRAFSAQNMRFELAVIERLTGAIITRKGQFAESMVHLYRSRDILESLDSVGPLYSVYMNIGNNLSGMGDPRASIPYYQKASVVAKKIKDSIRYATGLMNEGAVFMDMNILDSAQILLDKAFSNLPATGADYLKLQIAFNRATILQMKGELTEAEALFRQVIKQATDLGDPFAIGMANSGLASVLSRTGKVAAAISIMEAFLRQQEASGLGYYMIEHTQRLITLYKEAGRFAEALSASERLKLLSDSLLNADKQKVVKELVMKYDFDQQEKEKSLLKIKLKLRNLVSGILSIAVLVLLVLGVVLRQRNLFQRELNKSYQTLLDNYRAQRDAPDNHLPPSVIVRNNVPEENQLSQETNHLEEYTTIASTFDYIRLHEQLFQYFQSDKPYLNPDLRVEDLAIRFQVPTRRITEALKHVTGQSYADYVNRFRVAEATRIMDRQESQNLKLEVIAAQCGFGSRQYFRRVFEQITGVNPSFYRRKSKDG
jgi:AraC-like DNA-binding protein